jgi:hypothetical protein
VVVSVVVVVAVEVAVVYTVIILVTTTIGRGSFRRNPSTGLGTRAQDVGFGSCKEAFARIALLVEEAPIVERSLKNMWLVL